MLAFTEFRLFTVRWQALKLTSDDLLALQNAITAGPSAQPIIRGTGGLRKMRFAPPGRNTGKSGALRVCYVWFPKFKRVYLTTVFAKSEQEDLTPVEKQQIKAMIAATARELERSFPIIGSQDEK